jgi:hypothetical protein
MYSRLLALLLCLGVATFGAGCEETYTPSEPQPIDQGPSADQGVPPVPSGVEDNSTQPTSDRRKVDEDSMEANLAAIGKSIDDLEARANEAASEVQEQWKTEVAELRTKFDQLKDQLTALRAASGDAWQAAKSGMEKAWSELEMDVKSTTEKWRDQ